MLRITRKKISMFFKNDRGMALVGVILLMLVLIIIAQAMIMLTRREARVEVEGRLKDIALYVADAGVEKAIHNINNDNFQPNFSFQHVGEETGGKMGEADVSVTQDGRIYTINSTGYIPSQAEAEASRSINAVVEVSPGLPEFAAMVGGMSSFAANIEVEGVVFSNEPISIETNVTFVPDEKGNVGIYCADGSVLSIDIGTNFDFDPENEATGVREILARGGINNSHRIPDGVNWKEYDDSDKTDPIDDTQILDANAMINSPDTYVNHDFGGDVTVDENGRATFETNTDIHLNGGTYYYPGGVEFNSNVTLVGDGNIVAGGPDEGSDDHHAIEINSNVKGDGKVNFVSAGGDWKDNKDININSNVDPHGVIQCPGDASISSFVEINGIVAVNGNLDAASNVAFHYEDDIFDAPLVDGSADAGVEMISWREM